MTDVPKLAARYKEARAQHKADDGQLKMDLLFGAGILLGSNLPGASSAVMVALERLFPDETFPTMIEDQDDV